MTAGTATLARLAGALAGTTDPARGAERAAAALLDGLHADRVTVWQVERTSGALVAIGQAPKGGRGQPSVIDPALLPHLDPGGVIRPVERHGHLLGVLQVTPGSRAEAAVLDAAVPMLALHLGTIRTAEDFALEVAERNREVEQAWRFADLVIDSLPVGLYVVDREYRIRIWNRKRETGTQGLRREATMGRSVFEVLTRQPADELRAEFDRVLDDGAMLRSELHVETPEGVRVYRQTRLPMRLGGDQVSHVVTIGEDVTEWRTAEARILLNEKLAAVGQLAAGVMHEINNPLATIGACAAAIEGRLSDAQFDDRTVADYLALITREVERCTSIVDGLLDFSRPRAHAKTSTSLNELVEHTLTLLQPQKRFRGVSVQRALDPGLPPAMVNREQIIQVLVSLMMNAADAMEGAGRLTVTTGRTEDGGVFVAVADSGPGMSAATRQRIFEPFFTTKQPGRGTGLGLSICYGIVQEHQGMIDVESEPGAGARFRVRFPMVGEAG
ncbi:MAG TPA: ATP-binding protein [Gemmatimonadales bacterium]|jgi:two-component system NtrC family sensor kinase|nr:ATP-binding protein [Gemmatimonadales bacterium]